MMTQKPGPHHWPWLIALAVLLVFGAGLFWRLKIAQRIILVELAAVRENQEILLLDRLDGEAQSSFAESPAQGEAELKASPDGGPRYSFLAPRRLLKIGQATEISVRFREDPEARLKIQWQASRGQISGRGPRVSYVAPKEKGLSVLTALISDPQGRVEAASLLIMVYKQLIIIKADDLIHDPDQVISPKWRRFISFVEKKNIKASLGLIGYSLLEGGPDYCSFLRRVQAKGLIELWNHGYDHNLITHQRGEAYAEFKNTPFEYQSRHLQRTQQLAHQKLGFSLHTFGAPGNAIDEVTRRAVAAAEDIKVWFFGPDPTPGKLILKTQGVVEEPIHHPNFQIFIQKYEAGQDYLVLQVHPHRWAEAGFDEFSRIIDHLIEEGVTFIRPYEYYLWLQDKPNQPQ